MRKPISTEEFEHILKETERGQYTLLGEVINAKTKVEVRHEKCGTIYKVSTSSYKGGARCPMCARKARVNTRKGGRRKTHEDFLEEVRSLVGEEYTVNSKYEKWDTKVSFTHNSCGNTFLMVPNSFLNGRGCPECGRKRSNYTRSSNSNIFKEKLRLKYGEEYTPLEDYKNNSTNILVKHNTCGNSWSVRPANLLWGYGCPRCKQSKGEKLVEEYLSSKGVNFTTQKKFKDLKAIKNLSFDFYLPEENILIEYQGQQHYYPIDIFGGEEQFKKQVEYDNKKRKYAKEKGYHLIEIPYKYTSIEDIDKILNKVLV